MKHNTTPGQMKRPTASWLRNLAACALTSFLAVPGLSAAVIDIGHGAQTYHFVLESPNVGIRQYTVHLDAATDASDLLYAILAEDGAISMNILNYGTPDQPNYFVNSVTYNGVTEANTPTDPWVPSWGHWVSGGQAGYPSATPKPTGTWSSGSGISSPYRLVEPGTWDALVYGDSTTEPSIAPVPEASVSILLAGGAWILSFRRRRAK